MSTPTEGSTPQPSARASTKSGKPSQVVVLRLSPSVLGRFPQDQASKKSSKQKTAVGTPLSANNTPAPENETESNATPAPNDASDAGSNVNGVKRKGIPGPKPGAGAKRSAPGTTEENGVPKPRGKPGPKKRIKLDGEQPTGKPVTAAPGPKLGPKANQGAINAGLRALDRSGKPCRRWAKTGFKIKSFTGAHWALPSWGSNKRPEVATPENGENGTSGSSDVKPDNGSSAVPSEKSNGGGAEHNAAATPNDAASSPTPAFAAPVAAAG